MENPAALRNHEVANGLESRRPCYFKTVYERATPLHFGTSAFTTLIAGFIQAKLFRCDMPRMRSVYLTLVTVKTFWRAVVTIWETVSVPQNILEKLRVRHLFFYFRSSSSNGIPASISEWDRDRPDLGPCSRRLWKIHPWMQKRRGFLSSGVPSSKQICPSAQVLRP